MRADVEDWIPGERVIEWTPAQLAHQRTLETADQETVTTLKVVSCTHCGRRFRAVRSSARFCTNKCKQRHKRRNTKTTR